VNVRNITRIVAMAVALAALAVTASVASAVRTPDYQAALAGAGYTVKLDPVLRTHAGLTATGTVITIDKGGKGATLELIDYNGDRAALKKDWIAENGSSPRPRVATSDFAGRVLYWNDDSVLAVDFREPNFREAAQAAGEIFLGRRGTGGPVAPSAGATSAKLPSAGTGNAAAATSLGDVLVVVALLGAAGVLLAACGGGLMRRRRR
jgi:hypothetical protein